MDEKMEIRLVNPTEDGFLQRIDWNKAELEENVRSIVAAYQGLVYTEDTVSDAKNDRAALRKLLNEIEDRRKLVKKKCMEPYEVFESDLKDVTALIKEQISIIDGQVKEYENSVKEEKKARLQDVYAEAIGELAEVLPFERVFEAQYLNVSFKESKAATEIQEKVQRVKSDLAAIDALDSKYKLNAGELSDEWTEFEFTSYATPSYFYTYFYNYVANTTVYITDVEILGYMSAYSESQLTILKDSIESEVKRATAQEGTLSSSIKQNAESITSKVSKGEMGSYITQYYNNVIIAFNKNSKYVQINPGEIAIYNYGVENSKKRAVFDQNGSHYWRDGYYVGKIGTNTLNSDNSKKGLNFDLEWPGAYMTWAAQDYSGASSYTMKWTYVQKNKGWSDYTAGRLHAGCDIDMHNWTLRNVSWPDGSINGTLRFVQIISMNSDGTAGQWSSNCLMQFKNGILIKGTWYG